MKLAFRGLIFLVGSFRLWADDPSSFRFKVEKNLPISEVVKQFNSAGERWFKENNVSPLDESELKNALALAGDSFLQLEKPTLAALARSSYSQGRLPGGSKVVIRNGVRAGISAENAHDVPLVFIYVYITTLPAERRHDGVPSAEEVAEGACLPVRLTKRPPSLVKPESNPNQK